MRMGAYTAQKSMTSAERAMAAAKASGNAKAIAKAEKRLKGAKKYLGAAEQAEQMGLTSIPGYARALKQKGVAKTIGAGLGEQWHSGLAGKAFIGMPLAMAGKELATSSAPGGEGRFERTGKALSSLGYAMAPIPLMASSVLPSAISGVASAPRKIMGKLRKMRPESPEASSFEPAGGAAAPAEHIYSPSAMGQMPEGFGG